MSKYTRKTKQTAPEDEFVTFWDKLFKQLEPYARPIAITAVTAAVLIAVVWGVLSYGEHKQQAATELFGRAVHIYDAELLGKDEEAPKADDDNAVPRFKSEKERADAALKVLDELDQKYGSSGVATEAQIFRAGIDFDQGRIAEAQASYARFLDQAHASPLVAVAREGLGLCKEQSGKLDEALDEYKQLEPKTGDYFRDRALWDEARVLLKKNDKKGAAEKLKDLVAKVPTSPLKDEAQNQISQLEDK